MKKKLLLFLLGLIFLSNLSFPRQSKADCQPWVPSQCSRVRCNIGGTWNCCDSSSECSQSQGAPMERNPSDASNPGSDDPRCLGGEGINTAIGCIPVKNTNEFMGFVLKWAVGVGGGFAFLLIVYASFLIMTSAGNPERLKAGQELLTSAISGLILLILSVFILKFIGVDILGLNQFGFGQ